MDGRLDCSLYKQIILILFLVFRFILIYLSFSTEFYFIFTIQSLFFLDTEFVLFFICSDLIDFIFIFITFHLSCTAVNGSWIKDLFIYLFIY